MAMTLTPLSNRIGTTGSHAQNRIAVTWNRGERGLETGMGVAEGESSNRKQGRAGKWRGPERRATTLRRDEGELLFIDAEGS